MCKKTGKIIPWQFKKNSFNGLGVIGVKLWAEICINKQTNQKTLQWHTYSNWLKSPNIGAYPWLFVGCLSL